MIQIDQNKTTTPTTITMKAISAVSKAQVISLLSSGYSVRKIASKTSLSLGTISNIRSQHCPDLKKTVGGHPSKPSPGDIRHAVYLLGSQKAETAVQVARDLRNITNQPLSVHTIRKILKTNWKTYQVPGIDVPCRGLHFPRFLAWLNILHERHQLCLR